MKKFALKSADATKENVASLLQFTDDDISETSADELVGMVALLSKRMADITVKAESLKESSGLNEIGTEISNIKEMIKKINSAILRSSLLNNGEKILVNVHDDDVVAVDNERYETEDRIDSSNVFVKEVSYSIIPSVTYSDLLDKLADLNILGSVKLGGLSVTTLTLDEFRDLKSKLAHYGFLCAFAISKTSFTADMKAYPEARQALLDCGYIVEDASIKMKKASNRQMSLFDSEDETALDVVPMEATENE